MEATPRKQVPGLSAAQATEIRENLLRMESAPTSIERAAAFALTANAFDDLRGSLPAKAKPFHVIETSEAGFLWMDESGNEHEHVIG